MNERGFVTVSLLALLPVLAAVLAAVAATFLLMKTDGAAKQACRVEVLRTQASLAKTLRDLMALNSQARNLRVRREAAEAAVAMGEAPAAITLEVIMLQQTALAARQELLLAKGKLLSRTGPTLALVKAKAAVRSSSSGFSSRPVAVTGHTSSASFDVVAEPPMDMTPDYVPSPRFRDRQEMKASWSFDLTAFLPDWVRKILGSDHLKMTGECSATLEKGETQWEPKITMARSSSSF
jgi:hypothetical protein